MTTDMRCFCRVWDCNIAHRVLNLTNQYHVHHVAITCGWRMTLTWVQHWNRETSCWRLIYHWLHPNNLHCSQWCIYRWTLRPVLVNIVDVMGWWCRHYMPAKICTLLLVDKILVTDTCVWVLLKCSKSHKIVSNVHMFNTCSFEQHWKLLFILCQKGTFYTFFDVFFCEKDL